MYDSDYSSAWLGCQCLIAILWIFVCVYVYKRAEKLGMSTWAWVIVVFLFGLFGFIPFAIFAGIKEKEIQRGSVTGYGGTYRGTPTHGAPSSSQTLPDPDFRDFYLEGLIDDGELREARSYLREMIQIARESNDTAGLRNYAKYEPVINKAAMEQDRKKKKPDDDWLNMNR